MRLDLIAGVLESANLGTQGESIFIYRMDADCKQGILLRMPIEGVPVDVNLPNYYKTSIQMIVRAADQLTGDALMQQAVDALTMYARIFTDTSGNFQMQINHLVARTLPRVYPRLDGQSVEWSVELNANYVMPTP